MVHVNDIRTITIDLDDTLWEIHPVIHRAEQRLYEWLGERYPRITAMFSRADIVQHRAAVAIEFPQQNHDFTFLRRTALGRLAKAADYGDGLVDEAMEIFSALRNDVVLFPEVRPALTVLRKQYRLVAVTNGNADLHRIGIDDLFHDLVSARTAGAAKPAPKIFHAALSAGGALARQTVHVGDHPEFDVQGAQAAGLHSVWVNRSGQPWPRTLPRPDAIVTHIGQLPGLLQARQR